MKPCTLIKWGIKNLYQINTGGKNMFISGKKAA